MALTLPELALFPPGAMSSSVVTTVWAGVLIVVFLHLRFGMTLSGLVIPGYLVPLLLIKPLAAVVTIAEGYATWGLALFLSNVLLRRAGASELFGRDRFFLLILASVVVRLTCDGWLLPGLAEQLAAHGVSGDPRGNLHSFGLIIVSLIANQLWNAGLRRGTFQLSVFLLATWLVVRYGLMTLTNFSISSLGYMYEDIAASILSSPKAYIILITTALVASRLNLRYGWDFNGILIPSLLALQWYQPQKLLVTFAEALVILALARLLLRLPQLARRNIEGARLMLLFFNIGFAYKLLLGWCLFLFAPAVKATDWYAFGYLLSTLIALRMHQKDIAVRMTRATLQASLVGLACASVVGYLLTLLPLGPKAPPALVGAQAPAPSAVPLVEYLSGLRARLYAGEASLRVPATEGALEDFTAAVTQLAAAPADPARQAAARALLQPIGMAVTVLSDGHVVVHDLSPGRGRGIYVLSARPKTPLVVEVPAALDERATTEAALRLYLAGGARALALAGQHLNDDLDGGSNVLLFPRTFFQSFHVAVGGRAALQLRGYTKETARLATGQRLTEGGALLPPTLWVSGALPEGLDLARLEQLTGRLITRWSTPPWTNRQREHEGTAFAELLLGQESLRALFAGLSVSPTMERESGTDRIDGYLQAWLLENSNAIAPRLSERYRKPALGELLFLDREVISPLLAIAADSRQGLPPDPREMDRIAQLAGAFGFRLVDYVHKGSGNRYLVLAEKPGRSARHWGLLVLRLGPSAPVLVQLPRPLAEAGTLEFGAALFEKMNAGTLLIATSHPLAARDGSADVIDPRNPRTAFHAIYQAWLRESQGDRLVVQVRGALPQTTGEDAARVILWEDSKGRGNAVTRQLTDILAREGIRHAVGDAPLGSEHYVLQGQALGLSTGVSFASLRLAPPLRQGYSAAVRADDMALPYVLRNIPSRTVDAAALLRAAPRAGRPLAPGLRAALEQHVRTGDIVALEAARRQAGDLSLEHIVDASTRQPLLLLRQGNAVVAVLSLSRSDLPADLHWQDATSVQAFLDRRAGWLLAGGGR